MGVASGEKTERRDSLSRDAETETSLSWIKSDVEEGARDLDGFLDVGGGIAASVLIFSGEPVVLAFFDFFGEICGDPGRLRCKLNSASSLRVFFDLPFPFALWFLESSEAFPASEPRYGDVDLPGSADIFGLTIVFLEAPLRFPTPTPIQVERCGAYRFDAIWRLQFRHSKYIVPSLFPLVGVFVPVPVPDARFRGLVSGVPGCDGSEPPPGATAPVVVAELDACADPQRV